MHNINLVCDEGVTCFFDNAVVTTIEKAGDAVKPFVMAVKSLPDPFYKERNRYFRHPFRGFLLILNNTLSQIDVSAWCHTWGIFPRRVIQIIKDTPKAKFPADVVPFYQLPELDSVSIGAIINGQMNWA